MLHQIKAQQFYTDLGLLSTVLSPTENSRIQGLFKAFEWISSTFQGRFNFQGLFKSPLNSSTFQACVNPECLSWGSNQGALHLKSIISSRVLYNWASALPMIFLTWRDRHYNFPSENHLSLAFTLWTLILYNDTSSMTCSTRCSHNKWPRAYSFLQKIRQYLSSDLWAWLFTLSCGITLTMLNPDI